MNCAVDGCLNDGRAKHKLSLCSKHNSEKWRTLNPLKNKELDKAQYIKDREKILAKNKSPERRKYKNMKSVEYRQRHPEKYQQKDRKHHETLSSRYGSLRYSAKDRGLKLTITKEEYRKIISLDRCHYCQGPLDKTGSSLDRKDNSLGYSLENVLPCCKYCNVLKGSLLSYDEMVQVIGYLRVARGSGLLWQNYRTIGKQRSSNAFPSL